MPAAHQASFLFRKGPSLASTTPRAFPPVQWQPWVATSTLAERCAHFLALAGWRDRYAWWNVAFFFFFSSLQRLLIRQRNVLYGSLSSCSSLLCATQQVLFFFFFHDPSDELGKKISKVESLGFCSLIPLLLNSPRCFRSCFVVYTLHQGTLP